MNFSPSWCGRRRNALLVQVLHTRSCTGVGMHFLHFLTACYLVFSLECQSISSALGTLPPLKSSATVQLGEAGRDHPAAQQFAPHKLHRNRAAADTGADCTL